MAQDRDIKYVNREFSDFRTQLIEYAKNYFPDTYNDFSPTSPGMMFMEMAAYVGDILLPGYTASRDVLAIRKRTW